MVLRGVLTELPPGSTLLLRPQGDERVAHVNARPRPHVEIRAGDRRLAALSCSSLADVVDRVRANVQDHWELLTPAQLVVDYEGQVSPRLRSAFSDDDLVADLPEGERPSATARSTGEDVEGDVGSRLDPALVERLRELGT